MVTVHIDRGNLHQALDFVGTVQGLCQQLTLNPEEVLVVRRGELLVSDDQIQNTDDLKILYVLSGG